MSMEFDCDKCGKLSGRYIILCPTCATKHCGTQPTDVQQLKAEIAALVPDIESLSNVYTRAHGIDRIIERMRQLSAV